ncbi:MAG: Xaa-Pro peptidase family protein [Dehalococcoidia bacterium]|nr:Xaa-Pro peptidase family protein [Dehalococcoidia bacterium]
MTASRLEKLRHELGIREIDAIFVSQPENRYYLSGFDGSAGFVLITPEDAILATDFRYVEQVKQQSPHFTLFEIKGRTAEWFPKLLDGLETKRLGFEQAHITFTFHQELSGILQKERPQTQLIPLENTVETLRGIKEPEEIEFIQRAAEIGDLAFNEVTEKLKPGITELQVAWELEKTMREAGSGPMPFEVIVAAGPNGALPHHKPSDRPINAGEPVVIDMGARRKGYCSDLTRTICIGEPDATFRKIYGIVQRAQEAAIEGTCAGTNGIQADDLARSIIKAEGYGEMFGHGLGHGVGLATHDPFPRLSPLAPPDALLDGMVFSIEPGIYLPGWGGVRIEDLVMLENGKVKLLSRARKWK